MENYTIMPLIFNGLKKYLKIRTTQKDIFFCSKLNVNSMLYGHFCVLYMMLQFLCSEYSKKVIFEVALIFQKKLGPLIISGFMVAIIAKLRQIEPCSSIFLKKS